MSQLTDTQLTTEANVIKDETVEKANTATRVGTMLDNIIDSKINNDKISTDGTLSGDSDTELPSEKAVKTYVDSKMPYKVYTALLTQSGGDDPQQVVSDGSVPELPYPNNIIKGVTYTITYQDGYMPGDFTPFGAPNNDVGTSFVANQDAGYYGAIWTLDYDNGAPIAIILENTIGNTYFIYNDVGDYSFKSSESLFGNDADKVPTFSTIICDWDNDAVHYMKAIYMDDSGIAITTRSAPDTQSDGILNNTPIEIRIYN